GESRDTTEVVDEALCLIGACEVRVCHHESADGVSLDRLLLGGTVADLCILHEYHPATLAGVAEPFFIGEPLAGAFAVDVGHRADRRAGGAQCIRHDVAAETSTTKNSGGEAEGNADDVLNLGRWHAKVAGDVREAIVGLEAIHEVLHARLTLNDERLPERLAGIH